MSVSVVGIGDEVQGKREFAARHLKRETDMRLFSLPFQIFVTITTAIYQQELIVWHPLEYSRPISWSCSSQHRTFQISVRQKVFDTRVYLGYLPERYLPNQLNIGRVPTGKYLLGTKVPKGMWVRFLANDRHVFGNVQSIIS